MFFSLIKNYNCRVFADKSDNKSNDLNKTSSETEQLNDTDLQPFFQTTTEKEYLIDKDYKKEKKKIKSNAELTSLNEKYMKIYNDKIELFYNELTNYCLNINELQKKYLNKSTDDMVKIVQESKNYWYTYYAKENEDYKMLIRAQYTTGSIVPVLLSNHEMKLCRQKAIDLYDLCIALSIEVEQL